MAVSLRAFISGCAGARLTEDEKSFFREAPPCGLILFRRNCHDPDQIRALVAEFHEAAGNDESFILIDQEGGRVQRLVPPHWRRYPPGRFFAGLYARDPEQALEAAKGGARLIAQDLAALGITVNCAPVLDLPVPGAHDVIGDRAYGATAAQVIALGRAVAEGYLEGGVLPVVKHIPGHGRAGADSHVSLPIVDCGRDALEASDFVPFQALNGLPLAMTAHVLIPAIDPQHPASASPAIIQGVIREAIGFDGLLMCDDIGMGALAGGMAERSRAVLDARCDVVLHCSGNFSQMVDVAAVTPELSGDTARRFQAARARLIEPAPFDEDRAIALLGEGLAETA
jgi:beta-N-acetylhexosaminidase